jgi:hypothetical protein
MLLSNGPCTDVIRCLIHAKAGIMLLSGYMYISTVAEHKAQSLW